MIEHPLRERPMRIATAAAPPAALAEGDFARFQRLVYRESGIWLAECKEALLVARLARRLRERGIATYAQYYRLVADGGEAEERRKMIEAICTHETHFFREPQHWSFLERTLLPRLRAEAGAGRRPRRVRALSAGCSTGEEPYTLAMTLLEHLPAQEGWSVEVVAADLSTRALERARAGVWPISRAAEIPDRYLRRYMLKGRGDQEGKLAAGAEVRAPLRFQTLNLSEAPLAVAGPFDLVFCRNVLIYFDARSRAAAVERLAGLLEPDGHLFVGHAESLGHLAPRLRCVMPTVYSPAARPS
jgi:chemotaxis protein methyltransferase CheR